MKKALFILMLVVVGVFVGVILSPPRVPVWQPKTQIIFTGFVDSTTLPPVTNVWRVIPTELGELAKGPPATYALFEVKDSPREETIWHLLEVSQQQDGRWKPTPPEKIKRVNGGVRLRAAVPVPATNAPLRVVVELERFDPSLHQPPAGQVARFFWDLRMRWKQWRYPKDTKQWLPRGPLYRMTNEFNFPGGTRAATRNPEAAH